MVVSEIVKKSVFVSTKKSGISHNKEINLNTLIGISYANASQYLHDGSV